MTFDLIPFSISRKIRFKHGPQAGANGQDTQDIQYGISYVEGQCDDHNKRMGPMESYPDILLGDK